MMKKAKKEYFIVEVFIYILSVVLSIVTLKWFGFRDTGGMIGLFVLGLIMFVRVFRARKVSTIILRVMSSVVLCSVIFWNYFN